MIPYDHTPQAKPNPIRLMDYEASTRWIQDHILENFGFVTTQIEVVGSTWFFYASGRRLLARLEHALMEELERKLDRSLQPRSDKRA